MNVENAVDDGFSQPRVTRLRTGMFSAEDGLMLAVFFAVVVLVALVVRCICVRWCHVKCSKCQHKQDDDTLSTVVVGGSRRHLQPSTTHHFRRAEPERVTGTALLERAVVVDPCNSNTCSLADSSSDGATCLSMSDGGSEGRKIKVDPCHSCRRGRRVSLVPPPSMETLVEEEEGGDPQPLSSKRFFKGATTAALFPKETSVVNTIYTFPHGNNSLEVLRTHTTAVTFSSCRSPAEVAVCEEQVPSTSSNSSERHLDFDPPSYDELFPQPLSSEKNPLQRRDPNGK